MSVARTMNLFRAAAAVPSSAVRVGAVRSFQSCKVLSIGKESEIRKSPYNIQIIPEEIQIQSSDASDPMPHPERRSLFARTELRA